MVKPASPGIGYVILCHTLNNTIGFFRRGPLLNAGELSANMPPRRKPLPNPLPEGYTLTDTEKKQWKLGKIIGRGGFGLIYLASRRLDAPVPGDSDFVIKVEYHENGPLFSELKFYQRAAKPESIERWKKSRGLNFLGIPCYFGFGLAEFQGTRYRFMVMDRLGTDLQKFCVENGGG
ncbi:hypothetical protein ANANG_G00300060 [Anguilla anguilla]|uniref:Protein kinase domain-containing protein n=1 Tax=Anguilla anguilla TaxID=7936 RepID=A0A9D3LJ30_ANGAN|nr:hypothetical protein ANANG_G00300060 [Anguilla anguilla]